MRFIGLVWLREVRERLRNWRFWLGLLSLPLLGLIVIGVVAWMNKDYEPLQIYYPSALALAEEEQATFLRFIPVPEKALDSLKQHLHQREALLIPQGTAGGSVPIYVLYSREPLTPVEEGHLTTLLQRSFLAHGLKALGLSPQQYAPLLTPPTLHTFVLSEKGSQATQALSFFRSVISILFFLLIFGSGMQVLLSVLEEKSNRLAEYLLIYVPPKALLTGKILAALSLTLFQAGLWGGMGIVGLTLLGPKVQPLLALMKGLPWGAFFLYLVGGLLLYAFLYAIGGASSDSVTELSGFAQSVQWPLTVGYLVVVVASFQPSHPVMVFMSHFPLTAPLAMPLRIASGIVPLWEIAFSLLLLGASIALALRAAARFYASGLLLYGQKLSWRELWHYLRR